MGIWSSITDELKIETGMIKYNCQWKTYYDADDVFVALLLSEQHNIFQIEVFIIIFKQFCQILGHVL